ncbi:VirB4 family type IV secretion system protein [Alicyclobacillus ferrooxydans]|uniref:TraC-like domain-containing protein n=1 Tax=Alicyclobacillus ferrooxydans TaxID=471514 RepID=A0A0P9EUQ7_9BACL|nr:hypothetical protein [Alicyclobacillus ferrooxydans]KPV42705.1 hypothetical protein AN477_16380 [Alicyclobacillus ferrooxydans]
MPSLLFSKKTKTTDNRKASNTMLSSLNIAEVGEGYIRRKDGKYVAQFAVTPINMQLLTSEEADNTVQAVREACNTVPGRMQILVSSERLNLEDYLTYLQAFADAALDPGQLERLESMIEYIKSRSIHSEKVLKFYLMVESQFDKQDHAIRELMTTEKMLKDVLSSQSIFLTRLNEAQSLALLYQKLNPTTALLEAPQRGMTLLDILPSVIDTRSSPNYYMVDDTYFKSLTISSFPTHQYQASWLTPIFELPIDLDVSIALVPTDKEKVLDSINKSLRAIRLTSEDAKKKDPRQHKQLQREEEDADHLLDLMGNDNESLFEATIVLTIRSASLEDLHHHERTLRTRVAGRKMRTRPLKYWALQPLLYTLPICYQGELEKHVKYNMPAETIGSMQPFNSSVLAGDDGIVYGINEQSHDLIIVDNKTRTKYPHRVVLGTTGARKSTWMFGDIHRVLDQNTGGQRTVIDFDVERERGKIRGNHVIFGLNRKTCINPFHIRSTVIDTDNDHSEDSNRPGEYLRVKCDRTLPFFRWIYPALNEVDTAAILQAEIDVYRNHGLTFESETLPPEGPHQYPTLSEFVEVLKTKLNNDAFLTALSAFHSDGIYARMFDGQTNWGFVDEYGVPYPYTRFDIHEFSENKQVQAAIMDPLLNDTWEFIKTDRKMENYLYVDEAHVLSDPENPHTLQFLFTMSKRGRKYGVYLTTATQNTNDFLRTKPGASVAPGQAILSNSQIKLLLNMDEKEIRQISEFVPLSEKEQKILYKAEPGHGILLVGPQHAQMEIFLTPAEMKLFNPDLYRQIYLVEA